MSEKVLLRARIVRLADRQLGHVKRSQLLELGASRSWIRNQVAGYYLFPVHAGVYGVGHRPRHAHCRAMAAVLACGEEARLSHLAAAALWDAGDWPAAMEVTAPGRRSRPGIITHRSCRLDPRDLRGRHGVPVTSPVRTVLDLQSRFADQRLVRLVNDLRMAGHIRDRTFGELCERSGRVRALLGDGGLTESELEDLFARFVIRYGLPMPQVNVWVVIGGRRRRVDAYYAEAKLIIELDSWRFHRDRASFERDRDKDAAALAEGFRTLRTTHRRLRGAAEREATLIRRILGDAV